MPVSRRRSRERGQVVPLLALCFVVLTGFAALTIDAGVGYDQSRNDQDVADAAALAATYWLSANPTANASGALTAAQAIVTADCNGPSKTCTVNLSFYNSTGYTGTALCSTSSGTCSSVTASSVVYVGSTISNSGSDVLANLGKSGSRIYTVAAAAVAAVGSVSTTPVCGLCILGSGGISVTGGSHITISNAPLVIDSSGTALTLGGGSTVSASAIDVVGTASVTGGSSASPTPSTGHASVSNPLGGLAAPSVSGTAVGLLTAENGQKPACPYSYGACTLNPGVYEDFSAGGGMSITMTPGIYVIEGGFSLTNGAGIVATGGVMLYFTCTGYSSTNTEPCTGADGGDIGIGGGGTYEQTAPSSGAYQGVAIMVDPKDAATITMNNGGTLSLSGSVDAAGCPLIVTGGGTSSQINSVMSVASISLSNGGTLSMTATASANAPGAYQGASGGGLVK
jgi:Flp pilus assembly protein TadG